MVRHILDMHYVLDHHPILMDQLNIPIVLTTVPDYQIHCSQHAESNEKQQKQIHGDSSHSDGKGEGE